MPVIHPSRWVMVDVDNPGESYVFPWNPNSMTKPFNGKNLVTSPNTLWGARTFKAPTQPQEWSFTGVLKDQAMHDALKLWADKTSLTLLKDHLGRELVVLFTQFDFTERRPSYRRAWKGTYTMKGLLFQHAAGGLG